LVRIQSGTPKRDCREQSLFGVLGRSKRRIIVGSRERAKTKDFYNKKIE
jgi:hypothetical protein